MKNYDDLILMHYGVKGMKWRYHKNNGSTSLYMKRQAQMRYSGSAKGRPNSGDAESIGKDPVGPNGNPENTRRKLAEQQKAKMESRAAADRLKAIADRNVRNIGPKERKKPQPIDAIKPNESRFEEVLRKPGRDLKRKSIEYKTGMDDTFGKPRRDFAETKNAGPSKRRSLEDTFSKPGRDFVAAKIKNASDNAAKNAGPSKKSKKRKG